jgi:hypothetical protein
MNIKYQGVVAQIPFRLSLNRFKDHSKEFLLLALETPCFDGVAKGNISTFVLPA